MTRARPPRPLSPSFTGMALDRAEGPRKDPAWVQSRLEDSTSRAIGASRDGVLVDAGGVTALARRALPDRSPLPPYLLGIEAGVALFGVDVDALGPEALASFAQDARMVSLRDAGALLSGPEGGLAAYLMALLNWHRRHRFCANCGAATHIADAGLARRCPNCGATHFPRMDPVVIMLVEHAGRVLLGRHAGWPARRFSALAGFVSPGETVEEAVLREVFEESGIVARQPRFVASQPWPFPSSLMLGFHAQSDGGDPVARDGELEEVRWFTRGEVSAALTGTGDGQLQPPPSIAIARFLIEQWVAAGG